MPIVLRERPNSYSEPVTEFLHGIAVTDPYQWLEDQDSPRTRAWIEEQTAYARAYLDSIPYRDNCRQRIREFLSVETYDSLHKVGNRYFFRRRLPNQQQPCICMREGPGGDDEILIDPAIRGDGVFSAVKPLTISRDGRFLLYEIKQGGEKAGRFKIFDVVERRTRSDALPLGYLRGFEFAPDCTSFYYVHEDKHAYQPAGRAVRYHRMGTDFREDTTLFSAPEGEEVRVSLLSDPQRLGILVFRFFDKTYTDFHVYMMAGREAPACVLKNVEFLFAPQMIGGRTLALTDHQAPNLRIVEVRDPHGECSLKEIVPQREGRIREWAITGKHVYIRYVLEAKTRIEIFDLNSEQPRQVGEVACHEFETVRLIGASPDGDEVFLEGESFTNSTRIYRCGLEGKRRAWGRTSVALDASGFEQRRVSYRAKDGTSIPMFLFGGRDTLQGGSRPVIMTAYGGYGIPMTPQFSVLVSFLVQRGCLFALPNIRGGSEFGEKWHQAAQRLHRQVAFDDFVAAAEWLINSGWTTPGKLAIFGGSNSGLLVGVALTQRPDLFRAVLCMVPLLDMLRYHLFDDAISGKQEFGTANDPDDFTVLLSYSPYHQVRDGVAYPATMIVSGDSDEKCNPLHARKMTARLQMASSSEAPIFLDYSRFRGHSPVLPLDVRIDALTDRVSFLCDQLQLL